MVAGRSIVVVVRFWVELGWSQICFELVCSDRWFFRYGKSIRLFINHKCTNVTEQDIMW